MNDYNFEGGLDINQNQGTNQRLLPIQVFNEKAQNLKNKISVIIIFLCIIESISILFSLSYFKSEYDSDAMRALPVLATFFPVSAIISIVITVTNLMCLVEPFIKIILYIVLFLFKVICYFLTFRILRIKGIKILFVCLPLIIFCACSFLFQIEILNLKKKILK